MRILALSILTAIALLTVGCWTLSVFPLYTEPDLRFDPNLLGTWSEMKTDGSADVWTFDKKSDQSYRLTVREADNSEGPFDVHLLQLGDHLLLDFYPEPPENENEIFSSHVILAHSFWRVALDKDSLRIAALDNQWLRKQIEDGTITIGHLDREGVTVLTAPTADLQKFVRDHIEEAFDWSEAPLVRGKQD
ncbi:MAG: hypothetical protein ACOZB3_07830 [Calditrichota bacterium]